MTVAIEVDVSKAVARLFKVSKAFDAAKLLRGIGARQLKFVNDNFKQEGGLASYGYGKWAPLKPNTIAGRRRGSSRILQDTGTLRRSFVSRVFSRFVDVGSAVKYAKYHERGTDPYTIRPRTQRFLKFPVVGGTAYAREVRHPGLPARPMLPTKRIAQQLAVDVVEAEIKRATKGRV